MPFCGSILQAGTCQILSLAENPTWSRVWQQVKKLELDVATLSKVLEDKEKKLQELSEMIVKQNETILDLRTENKA